LGFSLQTPAGLNPIGVTVDVDLQKYRRVIGRPARRRWINTFKPQSAKIQFIDEDIDHANRIGVGNIVIKALR
jgi:hypothetical protein